MRLFTVAGLALYSARMRRALQERAVKARILFGFIQVLSRVPLSYKLQLPASVMQFLRALAYLEIFDLAALIGNLRCMFSSFSFLERVYVQTGIGLEQPALVVQPSTAFLPE